LRISCKAGLKREHAATVAEVLVYADARGIHSHGAVRVEYYAERISKGGTNRNPHFVLKIPVLQRFCMPIMPPGKSRQKWDGTCQ
jgi:LDH2 family malate/lactate/ureidoglycolate dehydrogenase